jgi:class 3 adenylate cyclase
MLDLNKVSSVVDVELLVAFSDLSGFAKWMRHHSDREVFETMSAYTEFVGEHIKNAGGKVVKFIGDAALIVFPEDKVDEGVVALKTLREKGDRWCKDHSMPCSHNIKTHFGPVACGPLGPQGDKRFDIYGQTVNTTAILKSNGFVMSAQVFRKLNAETRKAFKKHTPPITYIPIEDEHRD